MSNIVTFPKPRLGNRFCVERGCLIQATRFLELAQMELINGEVVPVGKDRIFKFFCSEHAPQDAELL